MFKRSTKSSYFSQEETSVVNGIYPQDHVLFYNQNLVQFPSSTTVLWSSESLPYSHCLKAALAIPALLSSLGSNKLILDAILSSSHSDSFIKAAVVPMTATKCKARSTQKFNYILTVLDSLSRKLLHSQLTIPIYACHVSSDKTNNDAHFQFLNTSDLVQSIRKSLKRSKVFSMKSCLRITAAGSCKQSRDGREAHGMVRFEAVLPNVSFQVTPIHPIPMLDTVLLSQLKGQNSLDDTCEVLHATGMGYLTLNQTRKLVFVAETDNSLPRTPTVGVWVRFVGPQPSCASGGIANLVDHPFCWGACVRYLSHDLLCDRRFKNQETFLLVLLLAEQQLEYFEVTRKELKQGFPNSSPLQLRPYSPDTFLGGDKDFLCTELKSNLSSRTDSNITNMEDEGVVLGTFKPLTTVEGIANFREAMSVANVKGQPTRPVVSPNYAGEMGSMRRQLLARSSTTQANLGSHWEECTPAPRRLCPTPHPRSSPKSPATSQRIVSPNASSCLRLSPVALPEIPSATGILCPQDTVSLSRLVASQQATIHDLTLEVQRLSSVISQMSSQHSFAAGADCVDSGMEERASLHTSIHSIRTVNPISIDVRGSATSVEWNDTVSGFESATSAESESQILCRSETSRDSDFDANVVRTSFLEKPNAAISQFECGHPSSKDTIQPTFHRMTIERDLTLSLGSTTDCPKRQPQQWQQQVEDDTESIMAIQNRYLQRGI